jgi:uncharacterized membrane protein
MPTCAAFVALIYIVLGFIIARFSFHYDMLPLIVPLITGFALVGPIAAIGLYELSSRRERGLHVGWWHLFAVAGSVALRPIILLGLILLLTLLLWLRTALGIYEVTLGVDAPADLASFVQLLLTTDRGWALLVLGNGVGALFAAFAFSISVVAFPLLLDRKVTLGTAIATSVRAVLHNPACMAVWGLIVGTALVMGSLPALVGLAIVLPVLGHATWHLYRLVVAPPPRPA